MSFQTTYKATAGFRGANYLYRQGNCCTNCKDPKMMKHEDDRQTLIQMDDEPSADGLAPYFKGNVSTCSRQDKTHEVLGFLQD